MAIIDRRQSNHGKSATNRRKFIDRYKRQIKKSIEDIGRSDSIKDIGKDREVDIEGDSTHEPGLSHDQQTGKKTRVFGGNREGLKKGDKWKKPYKSGGSGGYSGTGEDDFTFTLTKEEFFNLYFDDMELPDFIKESFAGSFKFKTKRAGFTREGVPSRLNKKKTLEMAIARRIAAKAQGKKKPRFLDDVDMRFDNIIKKPYPIRKALMFCIMDVSGSMGDFDKTISKKFFLLLYLFLTKCYDDVDIRFIRHTDEAKEVDEHEFFYSQESGGTKVSPAFHLMSNIIETEVNLSTTNVYIAQASDGDNDPDDNSNLMRVLKQKIIPSIQYMAYIQTRRPYGGYPSLYGVYHDLMYEKKFKRQLVLYEKEVYYALRALFERAKK